MLAPLLKRIEDGAQPDELLGARWPSCTRRWTPVACRNAWREPSSSPSCGGASMPKVDLAYCMSLPPKKAVAYLKNKGYAITWHWEELWQDAHAQAFTVAKATRLDILQDIREAVEKALAEGKTFAWFKKELTPVLQAKGWWGKQEHVDADTGEISQVQLGSPWRLQTIFRTNLQTAYMAGRWQTQIENVDDRPYWRYVAILDGRTRPSHRAMNGKVLRYDDPFWQSFYPPNGWGCRCRVVPPCRQTTSRHGRRAGGNLRRQAG